jgi:hypothetical protein
MRYLAALVTSISLLTFAAAESPGETLDAAKEAHKKAIADARETMLGRFAKAEAAIEKRPGLNAAKRLDLIKLVRDEKGTFEAEGIFPSSPDMKQYLKDYMESVVRADAALGRAYNKAVDALTKARETDKATSLVTEWKAAVEETNQRWAKALSALLGTWVVEVPGSGYKGNWKFLEDGTVTSDSGGSKTGKWMVDVSRLRILILWDEVKAADTFNLPLNVDGVTQGESWSRKRLLATKAAR